MYRLSMGLNVLFLSDKILQQIMSFRKIYKPNEFIMNSLEDISSFVVSKPHINSNYIIIKSWEIILTEINKNKRMALIFLNMDITDTTQFSF